MPWSFINNIVEEEVVPSWMEKMMIARALLLYHAEDFPVRTHLILLGNRTLLSQRIYLAIHI